MAPTDTLRLELEPNHRQALRAALDDARGFLMVGGLEHEHEKVNRLSEALDEVGEDEPLEVNEIDAVRGLASLHAYREQLLDDDEIELAAMVEEAIREMADQYEVLAEATL